MFNARAATKRVKSSVVVSTWTKKRKTEDGGVSCKKRCPGKPSGELCQLNLDVLHLIAEYIQPLDLLNLARTCKSLRELLMDKSSAFVWKTARGQVSGLPDCPADLTEPEYANLVFHAHCHGCGKHAQKIFWYVRRRYCPECRETRLRKIGSCDAIVHQYHVLAVESFWLKGSKRKWVDCEQFESFLQEYHSSSDKEQFLAERSNKLDTISSHATECKDWENRLESDRRSNLDLLKREREDSIFERLEQHGYGPETEYHGRSTVKDCHIDFFKPAKPLTDSAWAWMLPKWTESMRLLRSRRIEGAVYQPRQNLLESEYAAYVKYPHAPVFDLLPHLKDLMQFPPFQDIIYAPEEAELGPKPFESAFEQLPGLVNDWRKQLDIELAELVKIPSSDRTGVVDSESSQAPTDRLSLACAMFEVGYDIMRYPNVFSVLRHKDVVRGTEDSERAVSIGDRFTLSFWKSAVYLVQACGLDPNVATVEDMDRRNARIKCLLCNKYIRTWRNALRHAHCCGRRHHDSSRWEIVDDEQIDPNQVIKPTDDREPTLKTRCLLCRRSLGDSIAAYEVESHLIYQHGIERDAIQCGVHYAYLPILSGGDGTLEAKSYA